MLVVDVEPELDPTSAAYVQRKHYHCWPNRVANMKTSLTGKLYPLDVICFLDVQEMRLDESKKRRTHVTKSNSQAKVNWCR